MLIGYVANIGPRPVGKKSNLGGNSQGLVDGSVHSHAGLVEAQCGSSVVHRAIDPELAVGEVDGFTLWVWFAKRLE